MNNVKTILRVWLLSVLLAASITAQNERRTVAIILEDPKQHIADFTLVDQLSNMLMLKAGLKVILPEEDSTAPKAPRSHFDLDRLLEWGHEAGSRYIIYLQVGCRRIETKKQVSIPYILSRYVVEGRIEGAYCLIDLNRSKVVGTWDLETKISGPRQWQVAEDYPDDPDLNIPAPRKISFLHRLEKKAAKEIFENVHRHLKGR